MFNKFNKSISKGGKIYSKEIKPSRISNFKKKKIK